MISLIAKYAVAWFGMMALAIMNGACRDFLNSAYVGDHGAHQISTGTLIALLAGYMLLLMRKWPLASAGQAWIIGVLWLVMTEAFELGMGLIEGQSWSEMLQAHNVFAGQLWIFIPLWVLVGPYVFYRFRRKG